MTLDGKPISCPRDGGGMAPLEHKSISTSLCGTCHGLWIPKDQLVGRIHANLVGKLHHVPANRVTDLCCPEDGSPLWEIAPNGILLDRCLRCGGLWFDRSELETVLANVRQASPPYRFLSDAGRLTAKEILLGWENPPPSSGSMWIGELVIEILAGIASTLAD